MRSWLAKRLSGQAIQPDPDAKTSCLRPARSSTLREKLENGMLPAGSSLSLDEWVAQDQACGPIPRRRNRSRWHLRSLGHS